MRILIDSGINAQYLKKMKKAAGENEVIIAAKEEITKEILDPCHAAVGQIPPELVKGSSLKWLQLYYAGTDGYLERGILPKECVLTNASGAYGPAISEYMIAMAFELLKKLNLYRDLQNERRWELLGRVSSFYKSRVLVVGLGDIGGEFAKRAKALGAYVTGVKRRKSEKPPYVDELYTSDMLDMLIPGADIVALALPQTADTDRIFDRRRLSLLKKSAIIINVGRGKAIDTQALCDLLEQGAIYGAALDVTDPEPLPGNHRLWRLPNAVITPHCSGKFNLALTEERVGRICEMNIKAFAEGKPLVNVVDKKSTYTNSPFVFTE